MILLSPERKLQAFLVACKRRFRRKKKAALKGRVPLRGIVSACEDVKMSRCAKAFEWALNINSLGVWYYFTASDDAGILRGRQPSGSKK